MKRPLVIDLFCGLGGWTRGFLAEGWDAVGFDIERHRYPGRHLPESGATKNPGTNIKLGAGRTPGDSRAGSFNYANEILLRESKLTGCWREYPAQLVLQDVLTLHGRQFKDVAAIVASPPCQAYSKRAMPFGHLWRENCAMDDDGAPPGNYPVFPPIDNRLFRACFRIQREACEAAGRYIPLVVENVKGAQRWVGRAAWHYGSYYLWGDVPALMPITLRSVKSRAESPGKVWQDRPRESSWSGTHGVDGQKLPAGNCAEPRWQDRPVQRLQDAAKVPGISFSGYGEPGYKPQGFNVTAAQRYREESKNGGSGSWFAIGSPGQTQTGGNPVNGVKIGGAAGDDWFAHHNRDEFLERAGVKQRGSGPEWFDKALDERRREAGGKGFVTGLGLGHDWRQDPSARFNSKSDSRKAASAMIAEIPFDLAQWIARVFRS